MMTKSSSEKEWWVYVGDFVLLFGPIKRSGAEEFPPVSSENFRR